MRKLTARELEVVNHLIEGLTNREIAKEMNITEKTVKFHLLSIFRTSGLPNRLKFVVNFYKTGSFYKGVENGFVEVSSVTV